MATAWGKRWYQRLLGGAPRRAHGGYRPWLEVLEDRTVPSFLAPVNFPTGGASPQAVVVADVNGDGKPDLVVANEWSDLASVLLGNGDGTFQPPRSFGVDHQPFGLAVADVNGDGLLDMITSSVNQLVIGTVSVLLAKHR